MALQWMGQGCFKPCWRHWNVLRKGSNLTDADAGSQYVEITCADPTKFAAWEEAELREAIDMVVDAHRRQRDGLISKAELTRTCQTFGYRATESGLLADPRLRSVIEWTKTVRYDWVHTFLSNGIVTSALWDFISRCEKVIAFRSVGLATNVMEHFGSEGCNIWPCQCFKNISYRFSIPPLSGTRRIGWNVHAKRHFRLPSRSLGRATPPPWSPYCFSPHLR